MSEEHPRADIHGWHAERVFLTQSVNCEYFGLDQFFLVSPPYPGLETIRNQTLLSSIANWRISPAGGSAVSAYFGGLGDIARRAAFKGDPDD
jgi:hypothetical protein